MKNLKRLMAVLVVVAMLATSLLTATAAGNKYLVEAQKLYDMGLYQGTSTTSFVPDLESPLNREQGVTMLVRMFGGEAEALALPESEVANILKQFSDAAQISDWARNCVAFAIKEGLVSGYPDGTFGPKNALLGKDYATLILRALGYEVGANDYHTASAMLVEKGGLTASMALAFNDKALIRDDFVGITFAAMNAKDTKGVSIIANLVKANVVSEEKALAAGLYVEEKNLADAEAAVAALEAAVAKDLAVEDNIKAAESAVDAAKAAVAKVDNSALEARLAAAEATVAAARTAFNEKVSLEEAAEKAVAALEEAAAKDLKAEANLKAAEDAVAPAEAAVAAVKDATVNSALAARVTAVKATLLEARAYVDAKAAVDAYKAAPYSTLAEITAAEALEAAANNAIAKVANADDKAALEAEVAAQKALVAAKKVALSAIAVESVKFDNLKSMVITFTKALDADSAKDKAIKDNVKIDDAANYTAKVSSDKKVLTIEFSQAVDQSDEVKLTIKNLKDADGNKIADYEQKFVALDVTQPQLISAVAENNKKIKAVFTEPVQMNSGGIYVTTDTSYAKVLVDGNISFAKFTPAPAENIVYIEFLNSLSDGTHEITISKVKDYAGFQMIATSYNVTTETDNTPPAIASVNVKANNKIEVVFNEELDAVNAGADDWEITQTGDSTNFAEGASFVYGGKKVTITFAAGKAFDVRATLGFTVKYRNVKDVFGNKNSEWTSFATAYQDDTEKPYVVKAELVVKEGVNQLNVEFSEPVKIAGNENLFELYNNKGELIDTGSPTTVKVNKDNDKLVEIRFGKINNVNGGKYTLKIKAGLPDTSIRANIMGEYLYAFNAKDTLAPTITSIVAEGSGETFQVVIRFSEPMKAELVNDLSNYFVGKGGVNKVASNIDDAEIVTSDYKTVTLKLPLKLPECDGYDKIAFGLMKDQNDNILMAATLAAPADIDPDYSKLLVKAEDLRVEATGKNTIVVKFNQGGTKSDYTFTAASAAGFRLVNAAGVDMGIVAAQISSNGKNITLTVSRDLTADAKLFYNDTYYNLTLDIVDSASVSGDEIRDVNGQVIQATGLTVVDKIPATMKAPELKEKDGLKKVISVTFDEDVSLIDNNLINGLFTIKAGNTTYIPTTDYTVTQTVYGFDVEIIKENLVNEEISFVLAHPEYLQDANENAVNPAASKTFKVSTKK